MSEPSASPRLTATPSGVTLCALDAIAENGARNVVVQLRAGRFHGFLVRVGDGVHGYVDRCPHAGLPLAHTLDDYLTPDGRFIVCSWHGALFERITGDCVGGPCVGERLGIWPVHIKHGLVVTS